ncbi:hypothetical protein PROFUN_07095 [Planoprotostelium fungivorum]|uniref:Uncharacterized protein n=1 Tax=Planoprotostelium fungivorum TaxID=1890364 RepID=A0A2P6NN61_9EUKA|nr:hypothetical protein PROFUN_07095 [Planoprotostelium fungivorum]
MSSRGTKTLSSRKSRPADQLCLVERMPPLIQIVKENFPTVFLLEQTRNILFSAGQDATTHGTNGNFPEQDWWSLRQRVCGGGCQGSCSISLPSTRSNFGAQWQAQATVSNNGNACWNATQNIIEQCVRKEKKTGGSWSWGGQTYKMEWNLVSVNQNSYKFKCSNDHGAARSDCEQVYQWSLSAIEHNRWYSYTDLLNMSEKSGITWTAATWMKLKTVGSCTLALGYMTNKAINAAWVGGYIQDFARRAYSDCIPSGQSRSAVQKSSEILSQYAFCVCDQTQASKCYP